VNCGTAIQLNTFQNGGRVSPTTILRVNPAQGRRITSPTVLPTRSVQLSGPVITRPRRLNRSLNSPMTTGGVSQPARARIERRTFVTRSKVPGAAPRTVLPTLPRGFGIRNQQRTVFNPQTQRYENRYRRTGNERFGRQSNRQLRNNAPRSERQVNRGRQEAAPRTQPSRGTNPGRSMGRSPNPPMQMPNQMGGAMGRGMGQPRGGGESQRGGPHR